MADNDFAGTLIQTKLHRPPLPVDLVPRPRLTQLLNVQSLPPFILISAPAGYGKSTLAKCLVEVLKIPSAWLSLDDRDNDLGNFLRYIVAAIETQFKDVLLESQALLLTTPLPTLSAITKTLVNELNQIDQPFILVLDDYHVIESRAIHDLLEQLILYPPRNLHIVLVTRMDPPIPLITLRARSQVFEFRVQDLCFNPDETQQLFDQLIGENLDQAAVHEVDAQTEGWVTGLRLAALAMRHRIGRESFYREISPRNRYVTEYLVSEILSKQAEAVSNCMLRTSILERFCVDLCQAVCSPGAENVEISSNTQEISGPRFVDWLKTSNLFVIPLDDNNEWFRYHHLFQDFLQHELQRRYGRQEIFRLHAAAGRWYARNGWFEEALYHLLAADDTNKAVQLVAQRRYSMMNTTQWPRLERWLDLFSNEVVENTPELLMLKTWLTYHRGQFSELPDLLKHLNTLLENEPIRTANNHLAGEISALGSLIAYHSGHAQLAASQGQLALDLLPPELWIVRVMARMYLSGSYLVLGEESRGYDVYYSALEEEKVENKHYKATLLLAACNFHWVTADLESMAQAAKQCIALSQETGQQQIHEFGKYQLGRVCYQQDNLPEAEQLFASVVSRPYLNYGISYTNSACGLAFTYHAQGKDVEAQQVSDDAIAFLLETGNTTQLPLALTLQAEIALMQGKISHASQWAEKLDPVPPLTPMPWFLAPHLTLVKVWLAQSSPASLGRASELLDQLDAYLSSTHNTRFLIEIQALQALLQQFKGDQSGALDYLEQALRMAQPGTFIRLFVDLGPQMERLITKLEADSTLHAYVNQIRAAFRDSSQSAVSKTKKKLVEPPTNRELEILILLAERKTNKEIAQQLGITPGTVRQHTHNLYQKLEVNNRRAAVSRAFELGLLSQ